jgi:DNA-directed RNA polymerase subunit beta
MTNIFVNNLGDLIEAQRSSYYRFLQKGINEELKSLPRPLFKQLPSSFIETDIALKLQGKQKFFQITTCFFYFHLNSIKILGPTDTLRNCHRTDNTYSIKIYIRGDYTYHYDAQNFAHLAQLEELFEKNEKKDNPTNSIFKFLKKSNFGLKRIRVKKDFYLVDLPLLTEAGSFLVNGCEKIIINQLIRSPGIYFKKEFLSPTETSYTATLISNHGLWTKILLKPSKKEILRKNFQNFYISYKEQIGKKTKELLEKENKGLYAVFICFSEFRVSHSLREFLKEELKNLKDEKSSSKEQEKNFNNEEFHLLDFFYFLGFTTREICDSINDYDSLDFKDFQKNSIFFKKENPASQLLFSLLLKKIFYARKAGCFSIGKAGRYRVNKRLGLNLPSDLEHLTSYDIFEIINKLLELKNNLIFPDDIDHIKNKQLRGVGELLQNQLKIGLARALKSPRWQFQNTNFETPPDSFLRIFLKQRYQKLKKILDYTNLIKKTLLKKKIQLSKQELQILTQKLYRSLLVQSETYTFFLEEILLLPLRNALNQSIKEFFSLNPLSQYSDQINPLSELNHKRKISLFGPNGLKRDHLSTAIRNIHPSQYGKICPIETPEGESAGLVMSFSSFARISAYGWIETPYLLINKSKVLNFKKPFYLNPEQESRSKIIPLENTLTTNSELKGEFVPTKENYIFSIRRAKETNFLTLSPFQIFSIGTSLIPFVEHNDGNRALMGSNMQRQALPVLIPESPFVGTGLEANVALESVFVLKSECEGKIVYSSSNSIKIADELGQKISYFLLKYFRSNQELAIIQKPIVWIGEKVYSGQIIADSPSTVQGELAVGKNIFLAYMPWDGFNYEDAIVISERLVTENALTSLHISEHKFVVNISRDQGSIFREKLPIGHEILTNKLPSLSASKQRHLGEDGLVKKGAYVRSGDVLVGKLTVIDSGQISPYEKLLNDLFELSSDDIGYQKNIINDTLVLPELKLIDIKFKLELQLIYKALKLIKLSNCNSRLKKLLSLKILKGIKKNLLKNLKKKTLFKQIFCLAEIVENNIFSLERDQLDKLTQIKKLLLEKEIKKSTFKDTSFRVPANSEGRVLEVRKFTENFNNDDMQLVDFSQIIQIFLLEFKKVEIGDKLSGRHGNKGIVSRIVATEDMPNLPDGTIVDILLNPLGVPSRMNVGQLFECVLGLASFEIGKDFKIQAFDEIYGEEASRCLVHQKLKEASILSKLNWLYAQEHPGKILLMDGRSGEIFDNPITVGVAYILKLIHMVDEKMHARCTGPYNLITEQPLGGKSKKGGQRFGEMEVWALEAYGVSHTLQELLTVKSDDMETREEIYEALVNGTKIEKPTPALPEAFLTLLKELNALGIDFQFHKNTVFSKTIKNKKINIFEIIEDKLKIKELLLMKKEEFSTKNSKELKEELLNKEYEKKRLLQKKLFN